MGNGNAPSPHIGGLITDTIDLSTQTAVELAFTSYARQFFPNYFVSFSSDGGATWPDTIELFTEVDVNSGTPEDLKLSFNVSNYIGGSSNAMIQFIFAGNKPGNTNGTGYYFWQLDDIELRELPENELRFTDINGAPAQDISFNSDSQTWTTVDRPLAIPTGTYFIVINFFPNTTDGVKRIANSSRFFQPGEASIFQTGDGDWFGGFRDSETFEAPIIRLAVADAPA